MVLPIPPSLAAMEAASQAVLPSGDGWQFEPKWDGFRCLGMRDGDRVELISKSGQNLGRYFPEIIAAMRRLPLARVLLDGELVLPEDEGYSFSKLQLRLHPAESRVRRLSQATPCRYLVFDLLALGSVSLLERPLRQRRSALEELAEGAFPASAGVIALSPATRQRAAAQRWLSGAAPGLDGVIAKHLDAPYRSGERNPRVMVKVKRIRSADCVVGGFRYGTQSRQVGSLLLGLYDSQGLLHHVGFTSAIPHQDRPALTKRLERLRAPPGFTGRAPGGPSRWSTARSGEWEPVAPTLVVEVTFDHVTDQRIRHGTTLRRWRTDKPPAACTIDQLDGGPSPSDPPPVSASEPGSASSSRTASRTPRRTTPGTAPRPASAQPPRRRGAAAHSPLRRTARRQ